jgi:cysteinyl-tRNA synthetase
MAEAFELVAEANRRELAGAAEALREMLELVGLESLTREKEDQGAAAIGFAVKAHGEVVSPEALLAEREEARAQKDFERADRIRERLAELGWEVRDSADGARLVPKA